MTNTAKQTDTYTERDEFRLTATANGWECDALQAWGETWRKGDDVISVQYNYLHPTYDTGEVVFGQKNGKRINGSKKMFAAL